MSATRWTAPWSVDVEPDDREWVLDANGHIVCSLTMERGVSLPRAHLIAAAPDLAEALSPLAEAYAPWMDECSDDAKTGFRATYGDLRRARAALAKAKGEG